MFTMLEEDMTDEQRIENIKNVLRCFSIYAAVEIWEDKSGEPVALIRSNGCEPSSLDPQRRFVAVIPVPANDGNTESLAAFFGEVNGQIDAITDTCLKAGLVPYPA